MSRRLRTLAALATVALIAAGGSNLAAAHADTVPWGSAPGTLPGKPSKPKKPSKRPLRPKGMSGAPGTLPPMGASR